MHDARVGYTGGRPVSREGASVRPLPDSFSVSEKCMIAAQVLADMLAQPNDVGYALEGGVSTNVRERIPSRFPYETYARAGGRMSSDMMRPGGVSAIAHTPPQATTIYSTLDAVTCLITSRYPAVDMRSINAPAVEPIGAVTRSVIRPREKLVVGERTDEAWLRSMQSHNALDHKVAEGHNTYSEL